MKKRCIDVRVAKICMCYKQLFFEHFPFKDFSTQSEGLIYCCFRLYLLKLIYNKIQEWIVYKAINKSESRTRKQESQWTIKDVKRTMIRSNLRSDKCRDGKTIRYRTPNGW